MTRTGYDLDTIGDRLAIVDLINGYADATDRKDWGWLEREFYTEDATVWWNPESSTTGRAGIVNFTSSMLGTEDIVTYHHVASFTPKIDGDTAEATVRLRAMHNGVGSREGRYWESLARQDTHLVRTADGWRCSGYEWHVIVGHGSLNLFEGLRPAAS